jgi:hypothetical protein
MRHPLLTRLLLTAGLALAAAAAWTQTTPPSTTMNPPSGPPLRLPGLLGLNAVAVQIDAAELTERAREVGVHQLVEEELQKGGLTVLKAPNPARDAYLYIYLRVKPNPVSDAPAVYFSEVSLFQPCVLARRRDQPFQALTWRTTRVSYPTRGQDAGGTFREVAGDLVREFLNEHQTANRGRKGR